MCPLQTTNDVEPLSSTLHVINGCSFHIPPLTAAKISKNKLFLENILPFLPIYRPKF